MKIIIDIAAAYSVKNSLMYRWKSGFQLSAVDRKMAKSIVPTAPMTA
jgi:hypothetical protein